MTTATCADCGAEYSKERWRLGYFACPPCGEASAVRARALWCVVPMNKSNYVLVTDRSVLAQLNPKRTQQ